MEFSHQSLSGMFLIALTGILASFQRNRKPVLFRASNIPIAQTTVLVRRTFTVIRCNRKTTRAHASGILSRIVSETKIDAATVILTLTIEVKH